MDGKEDLEPDMKEIREFLLHHELRAYPYPFFDEYDPESVDVHYDEVNNLALCDA